MDAPSTIDEIYARKQKARSRFAGMTLVEKIDAMAALRRDLDQCFGRARLGRPHVNRAAALEEVVEHKPIGQSDDE